MAPKRSRRASRRRGEDAAARLRCQDQIRRNLAFFGSHLRQLRERQKLTQEALGDLVGVSAATVRGWEDGTRLPSLPQLGMIACGLGRPATTLAALAFGEARAFRAAIVHYIEGLERRCADMRVLFEGASITREIDTVLRGASLAAESSPPFADSPPARKGTEADRETFVYIDRCKRLLVDLRELAKNAQAGSFARIAATARALETYTADMVDSLRPPQERLGLSDGRG